MKIYYVDPADLVHDMEVYRVARMVNPIESSEFEYLPIKDWASPFTRNVVAAKHILQRQGQIEPCVMKMVAYEGHLRCIPDEDHDDYHHNTPNIIHAAHELRWPTILVTF